MDISRKLRVHSVQSRIGYALSCFVLLCTPVGAQENGEPIATPRWKFSEGESHPWRLTQHVDAAQQLEAGGEVSYKLSLTLDGRWEVEQVAEEGAATIRQSVDRIQLAVDGPGQQTMQYDSKEEQSPRGFAARIAPLAKVLIDQPLTAVVSPTGKVSDVSVSDALKQQLQVAPGAKNLAALTGVDSLEQLIQQMALVLPDKEMLSIGESWEQTTEVDAPEIGPLKAVRSFQLVQQRDEEGQQFVVFQPNIGLTVADPANEDDLRIELQDQETSGEIVFNRTAGRLEKSTVAHEFAVEFAIGERTSKQTVKQTVEVDFNPAD